VSEAEAEQDALLDPRIYPPAKGSACIGFGGTDLACFQGFAELFEGGHRRRIVHCGWAGRKMMFNLSLEI
jgi:hypothetical protein